MTEIKKIEEKMILLQSCFSGLIKKIGPINIGSPKQFPFGWRKAAKGRTVWRIVEEIINQNLEKYYKELGLNSIQPSSSEVSVYDTLLTFKSHPQENIYINIKSAILGGRKNKDDLSKAIGLYEFYKEDISKDLFIVTCVIDFNDKMTIDLVDTHVMPIAWVPDIYVNPSNNGNLQSSKYKDISLAIKRTNNNFLKELVAEMEVAKKKREAKRKKAK